MVLITASLDCMSTDIDVDVWTYTEWLDEVNEDEKKTVSRSIASSNCTVQLLMAIICTSHAFTVYAFDWWIW